MDSNSNINTPPKRSCPKCGYGNLLEARYCAECGFFLGESERTFSGEARPSNELNPERPSDYAEVIADAKPVQRCIRCGQNVEGLDKCQLCGLVVPEIDDAPDEFLTDFMNRFPILLTSPEKFVDSQPYHLGWTALIQPILWTTLSFIIFWALVFFSRGSKPVILYGSEIPFGTFLMMSMAVLVLLFPWLLAAYIFLLQTGAMIVRGRGRIERTCRAVCSMLFGLFLLLGTLLALFNISNGLLAKYSNLLLDSPWRNHYHSIPIMLKFIMLAAQVFFLIIQIRILAKVNYIEPISSTAAHILLALPVLIVYFLRHYGFI